MASATPSTSVPGKSTSALEERGVRGLRSHTLFLAALRVEWQRVHRDELYW